MSRRARKDKMIKRIHSNLYYVKNPAETARFYEKLGFDVSIGEDTVRVKLGDFTLAFIDENKTPIKNESGVEPKGTGIFTYVEVQDVDAYFLKIKKNGITPRTSPKSWPWQKREFVVKDRDGYKFVFFTKILTKKR